MKPFITIMSLLLAATIAWLVLYPSNSHADPATGTLPDGTKWRVYFALPLVDGMPKIADCNEGEIMAQRGTHRLWICDASKRWWSLTP